ncbi:Gfo/Idh/MocA family oxidoreductase [Halorubrum sp. SS5]|nr:Gfo/Idh/MocA family oxidoreductase [Halorubrum sp. SS5]
MHLRTAVIGAGVVATNGHLPALARNPRIDLTAVCDANPSRAESAADQYGISHYVDVDDLLSNEDLDWVHICTPVQTHLEIASKVIESGIHVLIQKPTTVTVDELNQLERLSKEHQVLVTPVHNQLFNPTMRSIRKRIHSGELGDIRGVDTIYTDEGFPDETPRGDWVFELAGGELEEGLPHPLYLTLAMGGIPESNESVTSVTRAIDEYPEGINYDGAQIQFVSEDSALCSIKVLPDTPPSEQLFIHGTEKSLVVDLISMTVYSRTMSNSSRDPQGIARRTLSDATSIAGGLAKNAMGFGKLVYDQKFDNHRENAVGAHYYLFNETAKAIQEGGESPIPLDQARWTIRLMEIVRET